MTDTNGFGGEAHGTHEAPISDDLDVAAFVAERKAAAGKVRDHIAGSASELITQLESLAKSAVLLYDEECRAIDAAGAKATAMVGAIKGARAAAVGIAALVLERGRAVRADGIAAGHPIVSAMDVNPGVAAGPA